jgi:hypothetical protein
MKEHPILFSTPSIKAILAGKKTMTRRIIKLPKDFTGEAVYDNYPFGLKYTSSLGGGMVCRLLPKWEVGDVLWVKEVWCKLVPEHFITTNYVYKADSNLDTEEIRREYIRCGYPYKWKSPIFMPRSSCRILLEITDIKAELLKSISDEDVIKEGVRPDLATYHPEGVFYSAFMSLWDSIHGKGAHELNPWVWCPSFKIKEIKS